jgi:hypothetical protein
MACCYENVLVVEQGDALSSRSTLMTEVIETAAHLYRAMKGRGLELRRGAGRDDAILDELRTALGCPVDAGLQAYLDGRDELSAAAFLRAFLCVAQPFALMFQDIWRFLASVAASSAEESLRVRVGFKEDPDALDLDLEAFRRYAAVAAKRATDLVWSRETLLELSDPGWELVESLGLAPSSNQYGDKPRYEAFRPYTLPAFDVGRSHALTTVATALQSAIDAASTVTSNDPRVWLRDVGFALTDILPYWTVVLQRAGTLSAESLQQFAAWFDRELSPRLDAQVLPPGSQPLDEIDLPFWRHRWHTYEIWVSVVTLRALDLARLAPRMRLRDGYLPIDGYCAAVVADLVCAGVPLACVAVQVQTRIPNGKGAIRPDLRISRSTNLVADATAVVVECKQRKAMTASHLREVTARYSTGCPKASAVIVVNYDAPGLGSASPPCHSLEAVRPTSVSEFERLLLKSVENAGLVPLPQIAVLFDCSWSMLHAYTQPVATASAGALAGMQAEIFAFADTLLSERPTIEDDRLVLPTLGGGTNLEGALMALVATLGFPPDILVLVSDGEHGNPPILANMPKVIEPGADGLAECLMELRRMYWS